MNDEPIRMIRDVNHFQVALARTLGFEGEYSNDRNDSGGETAWGITKAEARKHGYTGDMRNFPKRNAIAIYESDYWNLGHCEIFQFRNPELAYEMFDTGVNMGVRTAMKMLQRSMNSMNRNEKSFKNLSVDGRYGKKTQKAYDNLVLDGYSYLLVKMVNCLQGARYIELTENNEKLEDFTRGWFRTRI